MWFRSVLAAACPGFLRFRRVPVDRSTKTVRWLFSYAVSLYSCLAGSLCIAADNVSFPLQHEVARTTTVNYGVEISGDISTPNAQGIQEFPLSSSGDFRFLQQQSASSDVGPFGLKAARLFESAQTETVVGKGHRTSVALPMQSRRISICGSGDGLRVWCPQSRLRGEELDLLQMPFDVLAAQALLPSSAVSAGEKWNLDSWVSPMLVGVEAVVEQSMTCRLKSVDAKSAIIEFSGAVEGAVRGSATKIEYSGTMTFDRTQQFIRSLVATQKEKRSAGPVSPGLDVSAKIQWRQQLSESDALDASGGIELPDDHGLLVLLQTPLKLQLLHSREWHRFHETPAVLMMRQLRDGNLVAQCNVSSTVTVRPGQYTPDSEFLGDVTASVSDRKGRVLEATTVKENDRWRMRRVRAVGDASGKPIQWDYYLCTAASGLQYSIVFSYARDDEALCTAEADKLLATLSVAKKRVALPYR